MSEKVGVIHIFFEGERVLALNVNFVQFYIVCCFSPKNWTPEFKVKFCLQSGKWKQRVSYGLLIWVWRPDSFFGLQDVLCRV